jgi:hypothetical protein
MPSPVRFTPIPRERVPFVWEDIYRLLAKAIGHDKSATGPEVYGWLVSGRSEASWVETHAAKGVIVTTMAPIDGVPVCWLNYIGGTIEGGPRAFLAETRRIVSHIEDLAAQAGCLELRGGGRDWSRVFPDWERFDPEHPNRMRKRLQ